MWHCRGLERAKVARGQSRYGELARGQPRYGLPAARGRLLRIGVVRARQRLCARGHARGCARAV